VGVLARREAKSREFSVEKSRERKSEGRRSAEDESDGEREDDVRTKDRTGGSPGPEAGRRPVDGLPFDRLLLSFGLRPLFSLSRFSVSLLPRAFRPSSGRRCDGRPGSERPEEGRERRRREGAKGGEKRRARAPRDGKRPLSGRRRPGLAGPVRRKTRNERGEPFSSFWGDKESERPTAKSDGKKKKISRQSGRRSSDSSPSGRRLFSGFLTAQIRRSISRRFVPSDPSTFRPPFAGRSSGLVSRRGKKGERKDRDGRLGESGRTPSGRKKRGGEGRDGERTRRELALARACFRFDPKA
jgi:hypothetical protein